MKRKIGIFEMTFFILIFINQLLRVVYVSKSQFLIEIIDILQIICYSAFLFIVVKRKYKLQTFLLICLVLIVFLIGYMHSNKAMMFRNILLIFVSINVPYKKLIQLNFKADVIVFGIAVTTYLFGISPDYKNYDKGIALGFGNPNQLGEFVAILFLLFVSYYKFKSNINLFFIALIIDVIMYYISGCKTAALIIILTPILIISIKKILYSANGSRIPKLLLMCFQLIVFAFTFITAILFPVNKIVQKIDLFFSNRIFLNYFTLKNNSISILGHNAVLRKTGVYNQVRNMYNISTTLDCSYILLLLVFGVISTIIVLLGFMTVIKMAWDNNDYIVIALGILLAMYAFAESQFVDIYNFFVYFYLLSKKENDYYVSKKNTLLLVRE